MSDVEPREGDLYECCDTSRLLGPLGYGISRGDVILVTRVESEDESPAVWRRFLAYLGPGGEREVLFSAFKRSVAAGGLRLVSTAESSG